VLFIGGAFLVDIGGVLICIAIILAELAKTHAVDSLGLYASYMQAAHFGMAGGLLFGLTFGTVSMFAGGMWMGMDKLTGDYG
jgi:hypothetical protein